MNAIGGYFELELRPGEGFHPAAIALNSARHCFEYIVRARAYRKVYLPYYTCDVMLQPLTRLNISWEFYHINHQLEPVELPSLREGEAFVYNNYFGLKQECMERLAAHYGNRLIADNAQAFYAPLIPGIDTYYSPRKFFGVPDGGYLYTDCPLEVQIEQGVSYPRMGHLLKRIDEGAEAGYALFRQNSEALASSPIQRMSCLTERLLGNVDYTETLRKRRENYTCLHNVLGDINELHLPMGEGDVPLVYPCLLPAAHLRTTLISNRIFAASYWPNVKEWCEPENFEYRLAVQMLNLPVDQRYGEREMNNMISILKKIK